MKYILFICLAIVTVSCSDSSIEQPVGGTIWDGPEIPFSKASEADPNNSNNQDRITNTVWITRGNDGGQIYNANIESSASKDNSPEGTLWAVGNLADAENLTYNQFRAAVGEPKDVVGKQLVLYLVDENAYLSVVFESWQAGKGGGFSYRRSTEN